MSDLMQQTERLNFSKKRHSYGITLEEIAKKCGLSMTTVSAYERFSSKYTQTRTRDDNAVRIDRALDDIIKEKIQNTFVNSKKEEKNTSKIERKIIGNKICKYCDQSHIAIGEFLRMCGLAKNTFLYCVEKDHPYISERSIQKICDATGWTMEQLTGDKDLPVKEANAMPSKKDIPSDATEETKDVRYIFENGEYIMEYTIIQRCRKKLTKEEFMEHIAKGGEE